MYVYGKRRKSSAARHVQFCEEGGKVQPSLLLEGDEENANISKATPWGATAFCRGLLETSLLIAPDVLGLLADVALHSQVWVLRLASLRQALLRK